MGGWSTYGTAVPVSGKSTLKPPILMIVIPSNTPRIIGLFLFFIVFSIFG